MALALFLRCGVLPMQTMGCSWMRSITCVLLGLCALTNLFAHDGHEHPPRKVKDEEAHRPTPLPDRIILTWAGDPTTTQAVTWRTDTSITQGFVELAVATDDIEFVTAAKRFSARKELLEADLGPAHYHSWQMTDLTPNTRYVYRVGDGENWSEWLQFSTASTTAEPYSFVYFGDAQNDVKSHWSRVVREAMRETPHIRMFLHAGDLINNANRDGEWGEWFQAGGWANAMIPNVPVAGNHEYAKSKLLETGVLSKHWKPQFTLPENGPAEHLESTYWFDFQGTRFVILDSNRAIDTQSEWLETVLAKNPQPWTIVTFHHPIFSAAKNRDNPVLRDSWKPLFDKYQVDLVLQGHDHAYARSGLVGTLNVDTGVSGQDGHGTVYVVSVSGPKMYPLGVDQGVPMSRVAEDTQLFQVITIDGGELRYQAKTARGRLYDGFTIQKQPGGKNALIEQVPTDPPRRRDPKAKS
jgi:3',5'-cyclic AMP phosphodiesterase CpdA